MRAARVLAASVLVSVATTLYMLQVYLPAFNTPCTPIAGVPHPRSSVPPAPAFARRLLVIVTDGLSFDRATALPELAALRAQGTMRGLSVEFPSYTSPSLTSIVTGLGPRDSGIRLNGDERGVPGMDALPFVAADAGVPVRIRSRGWDVFERLMRAGPATDVVRGRVAFEAEAAFEHARGREPEPRSPGGRVRDLAYFYVEECDTAAHAHGTQSVKYLEAERFTGTLASRFAARLDLSQDVVAVLSDHGHVLEGGHGGIEPSVMRAFLLVAGGGIARGQVLADRPMRDVASTLAVLAGLPAPSSNLGRPMLDLLPGSDDKRAAAFAASFDEASSFLCRLHPFPRCEEAPALLSRLRLADAGALAPAEALLADLGRERDASLDASASRAAFVRLGAAALFLCALALARRKLRAAGAAGPLSLAVLPLAHLATYACGLAAAGYTLSFSRMAPANEFYPAASAAGLAGALVATLLAWATRARPQAPFWILGGTTLPFVLLAAWVGADPAALVAPHAGIAVFYAAPAVLGGALAAASTLAVLRARPLHADVAARAQARSKASRNEASVNAG